MNDIPIFVWIVLAIWLVVDSMCKLERTRQEGEKDEE
jgi:hypothetical protein